MLSCLSDLHSEYQFASMGKLYTYFSISCGPHKHSFFLLYRLTNTTRVHFTIIIKCLSAKTLDENQKERERVYTQSNKFILLLLLSFLLPWRGFVLALERPHIALMKSFSMVKCTTLIFIFYYNTISHSLALVQIFLRNMKRIAYVSFSLSANTREPLKMAFVFVIWLNNILYVLRMFLYHFMQKSCLCVSQSTFHIYVKMLESVWPAHRASESSR